MYIENEELWLLDGCEILRDMDAQQLFSAITLASREADEYCNTSFEPCEDYYTLDCCRSFYTRRGPLLAVTELTLHGTALTEGADYFVYPEESRVKLAENLAVTASKALAVRYNYGYAAVPATVKSVIADLIKLDAESKASPVYGMKSESWDGEYSYTRNSSKEFTPFELRRSILARLDGFIVPPYTLSGGARNVRARLL